jgi:hypothetical protein
VRCLFGEDRRKQCLPFSTRIIWFLEKKLLGNEKEENLET